MVDEVYSVKGAELKTELQPHQERGVEKALANKGVLLAWGPGSGKTLAAIALSDRLGVPVDAVMPAPLVANYQKEVVRHATAPENLPATRLRSYEAAVRGGGKINTQGLAIADEAHRLRNPGTSLHQLAKQIGGAKYRLLLTGSPVYHDPANVAPLLNAARGDDALPEDPDAFNRMFVRTVHDDPGFFGRLLGKHPTERKTLQNRSRLVNLAKGHVDVYTPPPGSGDFPERIDENVHVPMSDKQYDVYKLHEGSLSRGLARKLREDLPLTKRESANLNAFSAGLRQVSNTPRPYLSSMSDADELANAPKIREAVRRLVEARKSDPNFRGVVYSNYLEGGLQPYARALTQENVPHGLFHGGLTSAAKKQLVQAYNSGQLPALLLSSSGAEGLDLQGTKLLQALEPHWNESKIDQVVHRGIRYKSHAHLPPEERKVKVERYFSTAPESWLNRLGVGQPPTTIERYMYNRAKEREELGNQIMDALREASDAKTAAEKQAVSGAWIVRHGVRGVEQRFQRALDGVIAAPQPAKWNLLDATDAARTGVVSDLLQMRARSAASTAPGVHSDKRQVLEDLLTAGAHQVGGLPGDVAAVKYVSRNNPTLPPAKPSRAPLIGAAAAAAAAAAIYGLSRHGRLRGVPEAVAIPEHAPRGKPPMAPGAPASRMLGLGAAGLGIGLGGYGLYRAMQHDDNDESPKHAAYAAGAGAAFQKYAGIPLPITTGLLAALVSGLGSAYATSQRPDATQDDILHNGLINAGVGGLSGALMGGMYQHGTDKAWHGGYNQAYMEQARKAVDGLRG